MFIKNRWKYTRDGLNGQNKLEKLDFIYQIDVSLTSIRNRLYNLIKGQ